MWNTCLLYMVVEIRLLVNEISSFPEVLCKTGDLKNFPKFTDKHKKQSSGGVLTKDVLKNFAKLTDKHFPPSLFLNKAAGWKPETVRSSHWRLSVKRCFQKGIPEKREPRTLRGPGTLWGPRTLGRFRTLCGPRTLGGLRTLVGLRTR